MRVWELTFTGRLTLLALLAVCCLVVGVVARYEERHRAGRGRLVPLDALMVPRLPASERALWTGEDWQDFDPRPRLIGMKGEG